MPLNLRSRACPVRERPLTFLTWPSELIKLPTEVDWLAEDYFVRDTLALVYGPYGQGKTMVALSFAMCVATGRAWCGRPTNKGLVLYLAGEGLADVQRRAQTWLTHNQVEAPEQVPFMATRTPLNLYDDGDMERFANEAHLAVKRFGAPALIVIDTLAAHLQGSENSSESINAFLRRLNTKLVQREWKPRPTLLVVHHVGHSAKDRPRGHSGLPAAADALCSITQQADGAIVMRNLKLKGLTPPPPVAFTIRSFKEQRSAVAEYAPGRVITADGDQLGDLGANQRTLMETFHQMLDNDPSADSFDRREVQRRSGLKRQRFNEALSSLVGRKLLSLDDDDHITPGAAD
jgi:hypothetical protein